MEWVTAISAYAPVLQTLLWVGLISAVLYAFRNQCRKIVDAIRIRIERGSSLKAGPLEIGPDLRRLPYVGANDAHAAAAAEAHRPKETNTHCAPPAANGEELEKARIALYEKFRGAFLAHVIKPSEQEYQRFDIFIYFVRHKSNKFHDIRYAEFFLWSPLG